MSVRLLGLATELTGLAETAMKARSFEVLFAAVNGNTGKRVYQRTAFTVVGGAAEDLLETAAQIVSVICSLSDGKVVKVSEVLGKYRFDEEMVDIGQDRRYGKIMLDTPTCDRSVPLFIPFVKGSVAPQEMIDAFSSYISYADPTASSLGAVTWNDRDNPTALRTHCAEKAYGAKNILIEPKARDPLDGFTDAVGVTDLVIGSASAA